MDHMSQNIGPLNIVETANKDNADSDDDADDNNYDDIVSNVGITALLHCFNWSLHRPPPVLLPALSLLHLFA